MKTDKHIKLNEMFATAICGNDILSSTLYVSGITVIFAGVYAPLVLLVVAGVLYLYKAVYTEVVEALPVNGGAYNCLLNGTSKTIAAFAGIMTLLSYIATAVISAKVGIEYISSIISIIPIIPATISLLFLFAVLVIMGIKDSAKVALAIFVFHIISLVLFIILGVIFIIKGNPHFFDNLKITHNLVTQKGGLMKALILGFSASLLGVSGFESSANFVEEQDKGVFRKTLRNMLIGVAIFNPIIALVVLNSLSFTEISHSKDFLLAHAAFAVGGSAFKTLIAVDAFLVLSGAVLTSFVGVSGLLQRMTADACLPNFLAQKNAKGSYPRIVMLFFLLCSSILLLTNGDLLSLAGVYTISFLGVMSLFAFGNLILKETRTELKRTYYAPYLFVVIAFFATSIGIVGNINIDLHYLNYFGTYFIPFAIVVYSVIYQEPILKYFMARLPQGSFIRDVINLKFQRVIESRYIVFLNHHSRLFSTLEYLIRNENNHNVTIIHCGNEDNPEKDDVYQKIKRAIPELQSVGVYPHLKIETAYKKGTFGPEMVKRVSEEYNMPQNRILIGSIHNSHPFDYDELGGVRIIF